MQPERIDRAEELWRRFIGMFGGDSVKRKFGTTMPQEWRATVSHLDPRQIDRGLRRLVYSGAEHVPSLPAFLRLCRSLDDTLDPKPTPANTLPSHADGFDVWDIAGNRHLLAHILRRTLRGRSVGVDLLVQAKRSWCEDMRDLARNGPVPVETQRAVWADYLDRAEREAMA